MGLPYFILTPSPLPHKTVLVEFNSFAGENIFPNIFSQEIPSVSSGDYSNRPFLPFAIPNVPLHISSQDLISPAQKSCPGDSHFTYQSRGIGIAPNQAPKRQKIVAPHTSSNASIAAIISRHVLLDTPCT